jgi:hypothetical protein
MECQIICKQNGHQAGVEIPPNVSKLCNCQLPYFTVDPPGRAEVIFYNWLNPIGFLEKSDELYKREGLITLDIRVGP